MSKRDYYPAVARGADVLCFACAEKDVLAGSRPPLDDDPEVSMLPAFAVEGVPCARCGRIIVERDSREVN